MTDRKPPRVLIIAGSDPSGGAGVQADIKTVTALGGYAAAAVTALTVQDTMGVKDVSPVAPAFIRAQIDAVLGDIGADAVKTGMIGDVAAGVAIADALNDYIKATPAGASPVPIVLDPVLAATSGDALANEGVASLILERLAPIAALITPNADEAAALTGLPVETGEDQEAAGRALLAYGARAALVKGGHVLGDNVTDILVTHDGVQRFANPRITTNAGHGTGCTLASAIATGLAAGEPMEIAVENAIAYVRAALAAAPGYGAGVGPLNHVFDVGPRNV
ncbi:MAG: bifunctional hydroxymethylpyrimidine kinase/phosphomethylpyrimidine kinase [Pseudomonadota bacterium]